MKNNVSKLLLLFIFSLLLLFAVLFSGPRMHVRRAIDADKRAVREETAFDFAGEKITYSVKLGMVNLGSAVFHNAAKAELNGKRVNLVTFNTKAARFRDIEKIYSDSKTFLPVKVERDIRTWTKQEKITEDYDQKNFTVTITKIKGGKKEETIIQKDGLIHNAILLPFYVRRQPELSVGWLLKAKLPNQEFLIRLVSIENVKVPAGTFKTYHFESSPKKFQIWITTDSRRIPVKIIGSGSLGYVLAMEDYSLSE